MPTRAGWSSALLVLLLAAATSLTAGELRDVVYLKNGSVVKGTIVEQIPNKTIKIQTADGSLFVFKFGDIERIVKEDLIPPVQGPSPAPVEVYPRRNPGTAALLSVFIPGAGQLYNNQGIKAGLFLLAAAGIPGTQ